jgi:SAM-dependent methyltransferase
MGSYNDEKRKVDLIGAFSFSSGSWRRIQEIQRILSHAGKSRRRMILNTCQGHESSFWQSHVERNGGMEGYYRARISEYDYKTRHFSPYWEQRDGCGIDAGAGCISVIDGCGPFIAIDSLMDHYREFAPFDQCRNLHIQDDIESTHFISNNFGWAMCSNMIDHTPDPDRAIREIRRILKPGGKLFFEVNFDDDWSPAHYALWNLDKVIATVDAVFSAPLQRIVFRSDEENQSQCWAVYEK